jgi:hypothetical protein
MFARAGRFQNIEILSGVWIAGKWENKKRGLGKASFSCGI